VPTLRKGDAQASAATAKGFLICVAANIPGQKETPFSPRGKTFSGFAARSI
jgi:hypothetical protein